MNSVVKTRSIGPSPSTWYAIETSPLRAYSPAGGSTQTVSSSGPGNATQASRRGGGVRSRTSKRLPCAVVWIHRRADRPEKQTAAGSGDGDTYSERRETAVGQYSSMTPDVGRSARH